MSHSPRCTYRYALHARVTDRDRADRHGSVVRRGAGSHGPLYGVRWDDGRSAIESEFRLRPAHGGAAHRNHSARGKRAWRVRNRALGVVGTATGSGGQRYRVSGRLELKKRRAKRVVESSEMPGDEFFNTPDDLESSPKIAKVGKPRTRRTHLPKDAYNAMREARGNVPPDQLVAFESVWKSLWPTGRASLTERFAEWVEEHPSELLEYQSQNAQKAERLYHKEDALRMRLEKLERQRATQMHGRGRS